MASSCTVFLEPGLQKALKGIDAGQKDRQTSVNHSLGGLDVCPAAGICLPGHQRLSYWDSAGSHGESYGLAQKEYILAFGQVGPIFTSPSHTASPDYEIKFQ